MLKKLLSIVGIEFEIESKSPKKEEFEVTEVFIQKRNSKSNGEISVTDTMVKPKNISTKGLKNKYKIPDLTESEVRFLDQIDVLTLRHSRKEIIRDLNRLEKLEINRARAIELVHLYYKFGN